MNDFEFRPLTLHSTATGYSIEWEGGCTFHVMDSYGNEVDAFTVYGEEGNPPSESQAKAAMVERLQEITG